MVRLQVGLVGGFGLAQSLFDDAQHIPGLVTEGGCFGLLEAVEGGQADLPGLCALAAIQMDAGQQQLAQHALGEQGGSREEVERPLAQLQCLVEAVVLLVNQGLVKIDGGDPGAIVFAIEELPRPMEKLQGDGGVAVVGE